jgi:dihydroflavonol-4-reductase
MILVTGATGLVGGHLLWHLLQTNETVIATKRAHSNTENLRRIFEFYSNKPELYLNRIQWREADVCDYDSLLQALTGVNIVYHCAAVVSLSNGTNELIQINVQGTANLISSSLAQNVSRFCFVSSIAACGHSENKFIDEKSPLTNIENRSAYAQSKFYSEQEVWKGIKAGLNAVIVNPGVILGYSGTDRGSSELFARVRKGLPFYTQGGSGYIDVRDVVKIMIQLTHNSVSGERYILVAQNCSNKEVLSWIANGYNKTKPFINIGKKMILAIGILSEILSKFTGRHPTIDRTMARSASNRSYYSSEKLLKTIPYKFIEINKCIQDVCEADMRIRTDKKLP